MPKYEENSALKPKIPKFICNKIMAYDALISSSLTSDFAAELASSKNIIKRQL